MKTPQNKYIVVQARKTPFDTTDILKKIVTYLTGEELVRSYAPDKKWAQTFKFPIKRINTVGNAYLAKIQLEKFIRSYETVPVIPVFKCLKVGEHLIQEQVNNNRAIQALTQFIECKGSYTHPILSELKKSDDTFSSRCKFTLLVGGGGFILGIAIIVGGVFFNNWLYKDNLYDQYPHSATIVFSIMGSLLSILALLLGVPQAYCLVKEGSQSKRLYSTVQAGLEFFSPTPEAKEISKSDTVLDVRP